MNGAFKVFCALLQDFKDDRRVWRHTINNNPCTLLVDRSGSRYLSVYDYEDDYSVFLCFTPVDRWGAVKHWLGAKYSINPKEMEKCVEPNHGRPGTVTLVFSEADDDERNISEDELSLLRKVAAAVVEVLWVPEESPRSTCLLDGAFRVFLTLVVQVFKADRRVWRRTDEEYNPCSFSIGWFGSRHLFVYERNASGVCFAFEPKEKWTAVLNRLTKQYSIDPVTLVPRIMDTGRPNTLALEFKAATDDPRNLSDAELILLRKVAMAVVDTLWVPGEEIPINAPWPVTAAPAAIEAPAGGGTDSPAKRARTDAQ